MKFSLPFNLFAKYRNPNHLWRAGSLTFYSTKCSSLVLNHFRQRVILTANNTHFFHTARILKAKSFQDKENEYAHSIMENIHSYSDSLVKIPLKAESTTPLCISSELVKEFVQVTHQARLLNLSLEDKKFSSLIKRLSRILPNLSDEDLVQIFDHLCLWPPSFKSYSKNFKLLWNTLDHQCLLRFKTWDVNRKLLIADYLFCLRLSRISEYNKNLIVNLLENLYVLTDQQVVQLMFYVNLQRQIPKSVESNSNLQKRLLSMVSSISVEEIGIICIGFFKSESRLNDFNIIRSIMNRFLLEIEKVNTVTVAAILKFLRKSMHLSYTETYIPLFDKSISCVSNFDLPTSIQLALLSSECHVYHPLLLNTVLEKVMSNTENARLKDFTKLLQCLSHFNHCPDSKFQELFSQKLKEKISNSEIESYPRDLTYAVLFYIYLGHFDYDILNIILNPQFVHDCCRRFPETRPTFAEIDYCVEIECRDYTGHRLNKEGLKVLEKRRGNLPNGLRNQNMQTRLIVEISYALESLDVGKENILVRHILPHFFAPDIIVRLSKGTEALTDLYSNVPPESILVPPQKEMWVCFVVTAPFSFAYKSKHLTGVTAMKLRQLKKLGYNISFVPFFEIPVNDDAKKKYVKGILEEFKNSCNSKIPAMLRE